MGRYMSAANSPSKKKPLPHRRHKSTTKTPVAKTPAPVPSSRAGRSTAIDSKLVEGESRIANSTVLSSPTWATKTRSGLKKLGGEGDETPVFFELSHMHAQPPPEAPKILAQDCLQPLPTVKSPTQESFTGFKSLRFNIIPGQEYMFKKRFDSSRF